MTLKISCFDRAVFRRSVRRTLPLLILLACYCLLLPLRLLSYCRGVSVCTEDFFAQLVRGESFDKVCFFPFHTPKDDVRVADVYCKDHDSGSSCKNYEMKFLWFYYTWCGALRQEKRQQEKVN